MDLPARKRRRTSSPGRYERSSSPLKQRPRRPSFASPTKASLARFNPALLQRATSTSQDIRRETPTSEKTAQPFIFGENRNLGPGEYPGRKKIEVQAGAGAESEYKARDITPNPQGGRGRNSTALQDVREEEDLPETPSARAMEEHDTPRRGVLFSSPSKRPPRLRDHPNSTLSKPKQPSTRHIISSSPAEHLVETEPSVGEDRAKSPQRKRLQTPDPEIEYRKQEKIRLEKQVLELQREVAWCSQQVGIYSDEVTPGTIAPPDRDALIKFINKVARTPGEKEDEAVPTSHLLSSFLPYSAHVIKPPNLRKDIDQPIPSHRPVELDDPLPYLQMFTSFNFTTKISLPNQDETDATPALLQQLHSIDISGPLKLLTASIEATVDTLSHDVISLELSKLSEWAERELGTYTASKARQKDLSTICWAIGSYWDIARKRAEYQYRCELAFPHLIPRRTGEDTENPVIPIEKPGSSISRKDLLRHLGHRDLVLQDSHVLLRISWQIGFDWTGEAESRINVETAFPKTWTETDEQQSLSKVPETFHALLQSKGTFHATEIIVALLFSE